MFAKKAFLFLFSLFSCIYIQDVKSMETAFQQFVDGSPVDVRRAVNPLSENEYQDFDRLISLLEAAMNGSLDMSQDMTKYPSYTGSGRVFPQKTSEVLIDLKNARRFVCNRSSDIAGELARCGSSCLDARSIEVDLLLQMLWFLEYMINEEMNTQKPITESFDQRVQNLKKEVSTQDR